MHISPFLFNNAAYSSRLNIKIQNKNDILAIHKILSFAYITIELRNELSKTILRIDEE